MDPNATLQWLRELAAEVLAGRDADGGLAVQMAGLFEDLDRWACRGGAPPTEWRAKGTFPGRQTGGR